MGVVGNVSVLPVSEVFGPVWQGEGPHLGRRTAFVRLGLCNLSCEWCDTPWTWDKTRYDVREECPDTPVDDILSRVRATGCHLVTLSGGEPLMHHQRLPPLLLPEFEWHAETNGTIPPPMWWASRVAHTSVSPKVATHDPLRKRIKLTALRGWADLACIGKASFKFVATTPFHIAAVATLTDGLGLPRDSVWIMPEGTTADTVLAHARVVAPYVEDAGFNMTTRLHVLLYDNERAR
jgi:organic radical activating enzyme